MPLTPAAELRDDPSWVKEMLPYYQASCLNDPSKLSSLPLLLCFAVCLLILLYDMNSMCS